MGHLDVPLRIARLVVGYLHGGYLFGRALIYKRYREMFAQEIWNQRVPDCLTPFERGVL